MDEFNESQECLGQWMLANDVAEDKKVCVFMSVIGSDTYRLVKKSGFSGSAKYSDVCCANGSVECTLQARSCCDSRAFLFSET